MALRIYKSKTTGDIVQSLKPLDSGQWDELLTAPSTKLMVTANAATGKSKLKDSQAMLTERARNHSRDYLLDETIQINKANGLEAQVTQNFLNEKGERRRKIDDK